MMSDELETLIEAFARFPGIGPRQAQRMVYYLLRQNTAWVDDLAASMRNVKMRIATCALCYRHFIPPHKEQEKEKERVCSLCLSPERDGHVIMVVEKDMDLENIERSGMFNGKYFVLGGTISALEKDPMRKIRIQELKTRITSDISKKTLTEIILALSATPDGDDTADYVHQELQPLLQKSDIVFSVLGRGLSTGSELEYADKETLREAIQRRK